MAHQRDDSDSNSTNTGLSNNNTRKSNVYTSKPREIITLESNEIALLIAKDVSLDVSRGEGFATDTDISGHQVVRERRLQRWVPDDSSMGGGLEDDDGGLEYVYYLS